MGTALSLYLDALRFAAAFVVFLSHYSTHAFSGGVLWQAQPYGRTAVLVFFVLSGVIIAWVTENREATLPEFAISRFARIYSVVLPALAVTAALEIITPPGSGTSGPDSHGVRFAASLLFLGESWKLDLSPHSNPPFWSLNYEVWYYVLFGALIFLRGRIRQAVIAISAVIAGPKILLLFPVWLIGVAAWRWRSRIPEALGPVLMVTAVVAFLALEIAGGEKMFWSTHTPWLVDQYSAYDYIIGILVALFILGLARARLPQPSPRLSMAIRWLAGTTFGLYLLHYPLLRFTADTLAWPHESLPYRIVLFVVPLTASILLARIFEQSKGSYRRALYSGLRFWKTRFA